MTKGQTSAMHGPLRWNPATRHDTGAAAQPDALRELQSTVGNRGMQQLLGGVRGAIGAGQPLPPALQSEAQERFGADFSDVRIHDHPGAHALAQQQFARAFTLGSDIVFNAGRYDPAGTEGRRLLGHELAHVVQQRGGAGDAGAAHEAAADAAAGALAHGSGPVQAGPAAAPAIQCEQLTSEEVAGQDYTPVVDPSIAAALEQIRLELAEIEPLVIKTAEDVRSRPADQALAVVVGLQTRLDNDMHALWDFLPRARESAPEVLAALQRLDALAQLYAPAVEFMRKWHVDNSPGESLGMWNERMGAELNAQAKETLEMGPMGAESAQQMMQGVVMLELLDFAESTFSFGVHETATELAKAYARGDISWNEADQIMRGAMGRALLVAAVTRGLGAATSRLGAAGAGALGLGRGTVGYGLASGVISGGLGNALQTGTLAVATKAMEDWFQRPQARSIWRTAAPKGGKDWAISVGLGMLMGGATGVIDVKLANARLVGTTVNTPDGPMVVLAVTKDGHVVMRPVESRITPPAPPPSEIPMVYNSASGVWEPAPLQTEPVTPASTSEPPVVESHAPPTVVTEPSLSVVTEGGPLVVAEPAPQVVVEPAPQVVVEPAPQVVVEPAPAVEPPVTPKKTATPKKTTTLSKTKTPKKAAIPSKRSPTGRTRKSTLPVPATPERLIPVTIEPGAGLAALEEPALAPGPTPEEPAAMVATAEPAPATLPKAEAPIATPATATPPRVQKSPPLLGPGRVPQSVANATKRIEDTSAVLAKAQAQLDECRAALGKARGDRAAAEELLAGEPGNEYVLDALKQAKQAERSAKSQLPKLERSAELAGREYADAMRSHDRLVQLESEMDSLGALMRRELNPKGGFTGAQWKEGRRPGLEPLPESRLQPSGKGYNEMKARLKRATTERDSEVKQLTSSVSKQVKKALPGQAGRQPAMKNAAKYEGLEPKNGMPIDVTTGKPMTTKEWRTDHIMSRQEIYDDPRFMRLTPQQRDEILLKVQENYLPMTNEANGSKADLSVHEWIEMRKKNGEPLPPEMEKALREADKDARAAIEAMFGKFLKQ